MLATRLDRIYEDAECLEDCRNTAAECARSQYHRRLVKYLVKLEKVLGVTVNSNVSLDSNNNGSVAYPAGCTVVLFNTKTEQQNHIINTSRKTVTSLAYSQCGRYIVTGECGHLPSVRVWDLYSFGQTGNPGLAPQPQQVAEFTGHRYGVNCVTFSPNGKYVVSVGSQHDMIVNVWDWKNKIKVASNKISTKIKAIAFAENGSYFVTVGNRNVKFWYMEHGTSRYKVAVPLMGRLAILGEQRNHYFCDVACGKGDCGDSTYAITRSGLLCEFNNRRLLDKWVELRTNSANCIVVGRNYIFVGCAEGIIRCFNPSTLEFITTLPRPHYLGVDVSLGVNITHMGTAPADAKYPDCVAITYDEVNSKLTAIYNDHSIYVWHVLNIKRVGKSYSFLYHSACIWGVEMAPPNSPLPHGSFLTCSSDDTIRVWTLDKMTDNNSKGIYRRNIYSNDLLKAVYVDRELTYLKDLDVSRTNGNDKVQQDSYNDGRNGVRCIRMSPDGRNVASGDRSGNIRILDASNMEQMYKIEAHDAEVLCLEYCGNENDVSYMASASRDRLLHVFDAKNYNFLQTLDDHSSSITAVRFMTQNKKLQMVSCSADKSIIFRALSETNGKAQFTRCHNASGKVTLYDMEVDANQKHVLTACQDRNVRVYSVNSGKNTKCFKGSGGDDGTLIKVSLDRSGIYVATSCTDKSLSIYDYYSGECMATMCGHSELATGLRFTNDCRRLISASGDGCIFVWKIPHDMVVTMHARLSQQAMRQGKTVDEFCEDYEFNENVSQNCNYRFSVGSLPQWAKKHVTGDSSQPPSMPKNVVAQPRGKWAQRAENALQTDTFMPSAPHLLATDKRFDSDESKDSSLESTVETRKELSSAAFKEIAKVKSMPIAERKTNRGLKFRSLHNALAKPATKTQNPRSKFVIKNYGHLVRMCLKEETANRGDSITNIRVKISSTDNRRRGDAMSDTGFESAAHDADIDSDHEYKNLFYPAQADSASGSEFTVTNVDVDELRKSQRKKKESKAPLSVKLPQPNFDSNDSDDDEDDASTPSGDNTDRNPMSLFSVSSESLDQLTSREKFFQATFESMSGADLELTPIGKTSISSKFLSRSGERNSDAINAVKQAKTDPETLKARQELNKRIAETKKKLDSVGHSTPLRYSQSIHDLSHIPERDKWQTSKQPGNPVYARDASYVNNCFCGPDINPYFFNGSNFSHNTNTGATTLPFSSSVPSDLQLCGCYMRDIAKNTSQLSHIFGNYPSSGNTASTVDLVGNVKLSDITKPPDNDLAVRPRKLRLDKTLTKYKLHKSLPVSPVSEERQFSDYVELKNRSEKDCSVRKSFSYFVDFKESADDGLKQICSDIEKFSEDFNRTYNQIEKHFEIEKPAKAFLEVPKAKHLLEEEEGNFSSDSLEEFSFLSACHKKVKSEMPPRRCMSNNEIYKYDTEDYFETEIPKSESFYLNQNIKSSQDSILSDENILDDGVRKSNYNSMESILSNDSDCKSAPLEVLFLGQKTPQRSPKHSTSCHDQFLNCSSSLLRSYDPNPHQGCNSPLEGTSYQLSPAKTFKTLKTIQTQTDFPTPEELVQKKSKASEDFQKKLLKFEESIAQTDLRRELKKNIAYFIDSGQKSQPSAKVDQENIPHHKAKESKKQTSQTSMSNVKMYIPSLESKNKQYKSKYCNILNNKLEPNIEIYETSNAKSDANRNVSIKTLKNFEKNINKKNHIQETSSLDRHLFTRSPIGNEKIVHKPPKAVRRHSSKTRKTKTSYEYIKKEDYFGKMKNNREKNQEEHVLEVSFKEKNSEKDLESCNSRSTANVNFFSELYDSLDKTSMNPKMDYDSLELNLNLPKGGDDRIYDSLEPDTKNMWVESISKTTDMAASNLENTFPRRSPDDKIQFALENIKILNEIQRKVHKINSLVEVFKKNMSRGKVHALSSMYESFKTSQSYYNDLTSLQATPIKFRRRNLSLPAFVERRLNHEPKVVNVEKNGKVSEATERKEKASESTERKEKASEAVEDRREASYLDESSPDSSLRRSCSLSDLSMQNASTFKRKNEPISGKKAPQNHVSRNNTRYVKNNAITRSRSSGGLNQSDSDNDSQDKKMSRLMRPTISSHNKINSKNLQNRKKQSYSTNNLNTVGVDNISTSDEESEPVVKPAVPPRSRPGNFENGHPSVVPRRLLNNKEKTRANRHTIHFERLPTLEASFTSDDCTLTSENPDLTLVDLSNTQTEEVISQLTIAASNVVELYNRLNESDSTAESPTGESQVRRLEMSILRTHKILQDCIFRKLKQNDVDVNQTDTVKKLNDLVAKGSNNSQSSKVTMMEQYADILLDMVQQKIHNSNM